MTLFRPDAKEIAEARAYFEKHILGYASEAAWHTGVILGALAEVEARLGRAAKRLDTAQAFYEEEREVGAFVSPELQLIADLRAVLVEQEKEQE